MEKCANARGKLSPELVVVKRVDNDHPEKKETIHWADSGVFHRLTQVLDGSSALTNFKSCLDFQNVLKALTKSFLAKFLNHPGACGAPHSIRAILVLQKLYQRTRHFSGIGWIYQQSVLT
jgi:hypothetical protein